MSLGTFPPRPSPFGPRERRCGAGDSGRLGATQRQADQTDQSAAGHLVSEPETDLRTSSDSAVLSVVRRQYRGKEKFPLNGRPLDKSRLVSRVSFLFLPPFLISSTLDLLLDLLSLLPPASPYKSTSCSGQSRSSVPPAAASPLLDPSSGVAAQPTKFNTPHPTSSAQGQFSLHHSWSHSSHDDRCLGLRA